MGKLDGKVALVTGGNSGIGRGIVHRFIDEGAKVAFAGRDRTKGETVLREIAEKTGDGAFYALDLGDEEAVADLIQRIDRRFGRLDIVINNAGVGGRRSGITIQDGPGTRWQKMRGPNLDSTYFVSAYAMPHLARVKGAIVNISSTATLHGNWGLYCVVKAAVEGLTRAQAAEGGPHGIRANCISPGWISTENDTASPPSGAASGEWQVSPSVLGRTGTTAEIASAALFLASDEASYVTGQTLIVDGGLSITDYTSLPILAVHGKKLQSGTI